MRKQRLKLKLRQYELDILSMYENEIEIDEMTDTIALMYNIDYSVALLIVVSTIVRHIKVGIAV